jgi:hypothetical protein
MASRASFLAASGIVFGIGCGGPQSWQPPPPTGATYQYDHQGFISSDTTVVAGTSGGLPAYGAAFAFRRARGVREEEGGKNPFAQSVPIDGMTFNGHLPSQGARLSPGTVEGSAATPRPQGGRPPSLDDGGDAPREGDGARGGRR